MGTTIRPELSDRNEYWIEKHRYYELKHFCLQYPIWKKAYFALNEFNKKSIDLASFIKTGKNSDPTAQCAEARIFYSDRISMIENVAKETDLTLWNYILHAVTEGISYDCLRVRFNIPCCKDNYYKLYRRFFWLLNKARG